MTHAIASSVWAEWEKTLVSITKHIRGHSGHHICKWVGHYYSLTQWENSLPNHIGDQRALGKKQQRATDKILTCSSPPRPIMTLLIDCYTLDGRVEAETQSGSELPEPSVHKTCAVNPSCNDHAQANQLNV